MTQKSFAILFRVNQSPETVFNAVIRVREWWSHSLGGQSCEQGDEFTYRFEDLQVSVQRITTIVENRQIVWLVTESYLAAFDQKDEWTGTEISFEMTPVPEGTQVLFTHHGLTRACSCYEWCASRWVHDLHNGLLPLINQGIGFPELSQHQ